ncbi:MAG: hypothetical protein QOE70_5061 [Chthoniobacter sp.]|jgi:hypothetical protein|nr:hypothetical protein [Chthoniobacter sp.]
MTLCFSRSTRERLENPKSYTLVGKPNPYPALFGGTPSYAILEGIPWDKLQFPGFLLITFLPTADSPQL